MVHQNERHNDGDDVDDHRRYRHRHCTVVGLCVCVCLCLCLCLFCFVYVSREDGLEGMYYHAVEEGKFLVARCCSLISSAWLGLALASLLCSFVVLLYC